jgi:hypothetical protein
MVPPWVPDIPSPAPVPDGAPDKDTSPAVPPQPILIAPAGRFGKARRHLGEFARTGDRDSMQRGVGRYIQTGYGGSTTATRRFGGTAQTASALYSALSSGTGNPYEAPGSPLDPVLIAGHSADSVMDAVVEAVRPVDGTQDTEASRTSIRDALSELLTRFPDADLLNLEEQQREFAIERYVAMDIFRRFDLDLGKTIRDKASSAAAGLGRLKEVRNYIKETVAAAFRQLRDAGQRMGAGGITQIVQNALREAFKVFEGYAE